MMPPFLPDVAHQLVDQRSNAMWNENMSFARSLRSSLTLPAICAPMFQVTGPAMVREACKAGVVGAIPRHNARSIEEFESWLTDIRRDLDAHAADNPLGLIGPIAANLSSGMSSDELRANLRICGQSGVEIIITAAGDPTETIKEVHDWGGKVIHDVTSMRFAEKAIAAGADGVACIGAGGGGHSGTLSHLAFIPKVRAIFTGVIVMAGAISTGAAIRAAEVLGADLAYLGTRFIATEEAAVPDEYKQLLVSEGAHDLQYTGAITGIPANWISESIRRVGLDPQALPEPRGKRSRDHLPTSVRPWANLWSAGQGIDLIDDIPSVAELVLRLRSEYVEACDIPDMRDVARVTDSGFASTSVDGQLDKSPGGSPRSG
jgi:nitronate monooxygenase